MSKKYYVWALLLLLSSAAWSAKKKPVELDNLLGSWVPEPYLRSLNERRATFERPAEELIFRKNKDELTWYLSWSNFHEKAEYEVASLKLQKDDMYELKFVRPEGTACRLKVTKDTAGAIQSFQFETNCLASAKDVPYVSIPKPLETYAIQRLLTGKYRDKKNGEYSFRDDGKAEWPDRNFKFNISLDSSETDCDNYFYMTEAKTRLSPNAYGFRWNGLELQLFEIVAGNVPMHCKEELFMALEREENLPIDTAP